MPSHASLTGANLHEPKGADSASANTVYVANGSGSGTWQKVGANSIGSDIYNSNKIWLTAVLADVSTASSVYIPVPRACTLSKVTSIISNTITSANSTITVTKVGGGVAGTMTIAYSGSAEGDIDELTPASNNTFTAGQWFKIATDGGSSTTATITFLIELTLT